MIEYTKIFNNRRLHFFLEILFVGLRLFLPFISMYGNSLYNHQKDLAFPSKISHISALCEIYQAYYKKNSTGVGVA